MDRLITDLSPASDAGALDGGAVAEDRHWPIQIGRPASLQPALWGPARPGAACPPMRPQGGAAPGHASRLPLRAVAVGSGVGVVDVAGRGGVAVLVRPADVVGQEAVHETGSGASKTCGVSALRMVEVNN